MSASDTSAESQTTSETASPDVHSDGSGPLPPLFVRHEVNGIAYGRIDQGDGLAIIGSFPIGMTLDGVDHTSTQRTFLEALAVGHSFVAYDERGAGSSAAVGPPEDWEQLGSDMWAVADAAGIERAILYGVFDAAYTAVQAAAMQPDRVLGLILNFMPPAFGKAEGVSAELMDTWSLSTDPEMALRFEPATMLRQLGLDEGDSNALGKAWVASTLPQTVQARAALLQRFDYAPLLRSCTAPGLIIEPQRRALFRGWGDTIAQSYPEAKVVRPTRGSEALGAIYAYLVLRSLIAGPLASRLSANQSQTVEASERAVRELDCIVVPVDETVASGRAVNLAARLGGDQNAELVLLHVITVHRSRALDDPPPEAVERAEEALEMGSAIAARHNVRLRTRISYQRSLVEGIVRIATEEDADLIVIGNPADEAEGGSPMGNIVEELLKRAPCEVLVDRGDRMEGAEAS
jgi:nucleotide-binding universal stress UspA family protein/pimeloyl-ACP methyl ester carboxylesterase